MPAYHLLHDRLSTRTRNIFSRVRVRLGLFVISLMFTAMITAICLPAHAPLYAQGGALYVKADASGANNGTSWTDAYTDLQEALDAAQSGNEIWVAAGIYKPVAPENPASVTFSEQEISFELRNGVAVYGGFAGGETERAARNWETNITILSGDISDNDIDLENGVITDPDNIRFLNSFHVVTGNAVDATAILDGFTITGGDADSSAPNTNGGGILILDGSPTLRNLLVRGNYAYDDGGGVYSINSNLTLTNIILRDNEAFYGGGLAGSGGVRPC